MRATDLQVYQLDISVGYMCQDDTHEDLAELSAPSREHSFFPSPLRREDIQEEDFGTLSIRAPRKHEFLLATGFSIGLHASVLTLVILTSLFFRPFNTPHSPFITINLIAPDGFCPGPAGQGTGREGIRAESGNPSSGISLQPNTSPVSEETAGCAPSEALPSTEKNSQEELTPKSLEPVSIAAGRQTTAARRVAASIDQKKPARTPKPLMEKERETALDEPAAVTSTLAKSAETSFISDASGISPESSSSNGLGTPSGSGNGRNNSSAEGRHGGSGASAGEFDARKVDIPPTPIHKVEPEFPLEARRIGITGKVVLRFLVKANGNVVNASVIEANPGQIFEKNALEAIKKWRFRPGYYRGIAVATWVELPIQFRLYR